MSVDVKQVYEEISADEGKVLHAWTFTGLVLMLLMTSVSQRIGATSCSKRMSRLRLVGVRRYTATGKNFLRKCNMF